MTYKYAVMQYEKDDRFWSPRRHTLLLTLLPGCTRSQAAIGAFQCVEHVQGWNGEFCASVVCLCIGLLGSKFQNSFLPSGTARPLSSDRGYSAPLALVSVSAGFLPIFQDKMRASWLLAPVALSMLCLSAQHSPAGNWAMGIRA